MNYLIEEAHNEAVDDFSSPQRQARRHSTMKYRILNLSPFQRKKPWKSSMKEETGNVSSQGNFLPDSRSFEFERQLSNESSEISDYSASIEDEPTDSIVPHQEHSKLINVWQTVTLILKSFLGTGILFFPRAYYNGGLLVSNLILMAVFGACIYCMCLLLDICSSECPTHPPQPAYASASTEDSESPPPPTIVIGTAPDDCESFGDVAFKAFGKTGQRLINISIILSQFSFCTIYCIFIAYNVRDLVLSLTGCDYDLSIVFLLLVEFFILTPISWIRRMKYLSPYLMIANNLIIVCLFFLTMSILWEGARTSRENVVVRLFNKDRWLLMLATAVYSFEGICMILPIRASMKPELKPKFKKILITTLLVIALFVMAYSSICYWNFGQDVKSIILYNLPPAVGVYFVQIFYTVAILLTYPLMLFPAMKLFESRIFGVRRFVTLMKKMEKNAFRTILVLLTLLVGAFGSSQLENFVAIIGSFCCVPLALLYPIIFNLKLAPHQTKTQLFLKYGILLFGVCTMISSTYMSIATWHVTRPPSRCDTEIS